MIMQSNTLNNWLPSDRAFVYHIMRSGGEPLKINGNTKNIKENRRTCSQHQGNKSSVREDQIDKELRFSPKPVP